MTLNPLAGSNENLLDTPMFHIPNDAFDELKNVIKVFFLFFKNLKNYERVWSLGNISESLRKRCYRS